MFRLIFQNWCLNRLNYTFGTSLPSSVFVWIWLVLLAPHLDVVCGTRDYLRRHFWLNAMFTFHLTQPRWLFWTISFNFLCFFSATFIFWYSKSLNILKNCLGSIFCFIFQLFWIKVHWQSRCWIIALMYTAKFILYKHEGDTISDLYRNFRSIFGVIIW